MKTFIDFFGTAHLNDMNIAAYENERGVILIAEDIVKDKELGRMQFDNYESAVEWFSALNGTSNVSRLDKAIDKLRGLL